MKYWKYILIGIVILGIMFLITEIQGRIQNKKIQKVISEQSEIRSNLENEVNKLTQERDDYIKKIAVIKSQRLVLEKERNELKVKLNEIENRLSNIPVPATVPELAEKFKSRGFKPVFQP